MSDEITKQPVKGIFKPTAAEKEHLDLALLQATSAERGIDELAYGINSMRFHSVKGEPQFTMACDARWNVYINFERFMGPDESISTTAAAILHELFHLLYNHFERDQFKDSGYSSDTLNIAQDLEINWQLFRTARSVKSKGISKTVAFKRPLGGSICIPAEGAFAFMDGGKTYEQYYRELTQGGSGAGSQPGQNNGNGGKNGQGPSGQGLDGQGQPAYPGASPCSGVGEGVAENDVIGSGSAEGSGYDPIQGEAIKQKIAEDIKNAEGQRGIGSGSNALNVWASAILGKPQVSLARKLRNFGSSARQHKQETARRTYRKPHRRPGLDNSIIRPTRIANKVIVALVPDTSGSMGSAEGGVVKTEAKELMSRRDVEVNVLPFDGDVVQIQKDVRRFDSIEWKGGGGTDVRVPLNYLRDNHEELKTDYAIVMTDCGTPWPSPDEVYPFPVLLVAVEGGWATAPDESQLPQGFTVVRTKTGV